MENFDIGRVFSRAFGIMRRSIGPVALFLLVGQIINVINQFIMQRQLAEVFKSSATTTDPGTALGMFTSPWYWGSIALSLLLATFMFAGSIYGMLKQQANEDVSIADCFSAGFAKFLPMLALTILWYLGMIVGFILMIVPGVILVCMWAASIPALVGEGLGPIAALGRSRALTKGSRWRVFAVLLVLLVVFYAVMGIILVGIVGGGMGAMSMQNGAMFGPVAMIATGAMGLIMTLIVNSIMVSIYEETRLIREGGRSGQLTNIFQ